jgi:hypothetical protein
VPDTDVNLFTQPIDLTQPLSEINHEQVVEDMAASGLFKLKTEYVLIGDEPKGGDGVVDLKSILSPEDYGNMKQYFTLMPRSLLYEFFFKKIWPGLPWDRNHPASGYMPSDRPYVREQIYGSLFDHWQKAYENMVWAAVIDVFNQANLEYINQNKIEPWTWEQRKTDAYYISTSDQAIKELDQNIDQFRAVSLALDPKARELMEKYLTLPKLGDPGLEITRQNAVKELLRLKEYLTVQAILDAYRYAADTVIGETLTQPVPYDIVAVDGSNIARAT